MRGQLSQPLRQAYALSFALSRRPTPQLASAYFETLKKMIDDRGQECTEKARTKR